MSTHKNLLTACLAAVFALGLAACSSSSDSPAPAEPPPAADAGIEDVRADALAAATAADTAADAADAAVHAQDDNQAADPGSYAVAHNAAERAREAADAAEAASNAAAAATTTAAAQAQLDIAEAKQAEAEAERDNAVMYAGMVQTAQNAIDAENQRQLDVADARMRAMGSYMDADADATKAEGQADAAEATAPGTPGATAARNAATAARTAADAAKAAHDAIMDGMTKEQADAQATEAATQAGNANSSYMTAKAENDDIQTASGISNEQLRVRDVAAATTAAGTAATDARTAATNARAHATNARTAANAAKDAYERAKSARTDSEEAKKQYEAADAAATAAENAATAAGMAADAAEAAHTGIDSEGSAADAQAAQTTAEARQGDAETNAGTAYTSKGTAETSRDDAVTASDTHVVGLLRMANAAHITSAADPEANRDETEVGLIERNRLNHVANVNTAVKAANDDATDPSHGGGTVTSVTWPYWTSLGTSNVIGGEDAEADTGPGEGPRAMTITPAGGDALSLRHAGPGADEDDPADDLVANYSMGPGLGDFDEFYISGLDATTADDLNDFNTQRVILFTDLEQGSMGRAPQTVSYFGEPVVASRIATVDTGTPVADTERDYNATYDHDGDEATAPIAVVLNCGPTCNLRVVNGEVLGISGYTFSTAGNVTVPGVEPVEDDTWIGFGMWLVETVVADDTNTYAFGAFADGGAAVGDSGEPSAVASVTGDATYSGKAAGVHSTATAVDFFHADATLTAKFGNGTEIGTITGSIHSIVAGGDPVTGSIELVVSDPGAADPADNIVDAGTFSGRARMGNTGVQDSSGEDIYRYTGTWGGAFYNHMENDADTADVDESTLAPASIAGTFGVGRADVASTMDMDETESYVGAFGAHCSGSNCNSQ